jgi:hypothetical protein
VISKAETGNHSFSFKKTVEVTPEPEDYVDELLGYIEINNWPSTKRVNDISAWSHSAPSKQKLIHSKFRKLQKPNKNTCCNNMGACLVLAQDYITNIRTKLNYMTRRHS